MKKEKIYATPQVEILHLVCEQVFAGSGDVSVTFGNEDYILDDVTNYTW